MEIEDISTIAQSKGPNNRLRPATQPSGWMTDAQVEELMALTPRANIYCCIRRVPDSDRDDVVQEARVRVWLKYPRMRYPLSVFFFFQLRDCVAEYWRKRCTYDAIFTSNPYPEGPLLDMPDHQ